MLWDRRLIIDAAAFYNDYRDMQVFVLINDAYPAGRGCRSTCSTMRRRRTPKAWISR